MPGFRALKYTATFIMPLRGAEKDIFSLVSLTFNRTLLSNFNIKRHSSLRGYISYAASQRLFSLVLPYTAPPAYALFESRHLFREGNESRFDLL